MNEKFYQLSDEKQSRIKLAGYKTFGENTYKKASMKVLADEAGISKALIFHYFRNKMALYQWLFHKAVEELNIMGSIELSGKRDFFDLTHELIAIRIKKLERYQVIYKFVLRVFNDATLEGHEAMYHTIMKLTEIRKQKILNSVDLERFKEPLEVPILYDLINDLANGYYQRASNLGIENKETAVLFSKYLDSIKRHYYKEEYL